MTEDATVDKLIDTAITLLEEARGRRPAQVVGLVGAIGILFNRPGITFDAEVEPAPAAIEDKRRKPRRKKKAAKRGGRRAPEKPRPEKPDAVKPAGDAPAAGEIVDHNGVTVSLVAGEEKVTFGELEIEVKPRHARLVACLAAANFLPVARNFIAKRVWAGERVPEFHEQLLSSLSTEVNPALEQLGLTIKTVRGVGLALAKVEA